MNFLKRITSAGLSLAMAATIIPASAFAANDTAGAKKTSTLSSVTAKYLDAENGKEIAQKSRHTASRTRKVPADDHKLHLRGLYRKC